MNLLNEIILAGTGGKGTTIGVRIIGFLAVAVIASQVDKEIRLPANRSQW